MPRRRSSHPPPPPPRHHPRHASASTISSLLQPDQLSALLAPFVPDPADRAFVVRCITAEGPLHHRGASAALLRLLGLALTAAGGAPPAGSEEDDEGAPVPLRLPPHLAAGASEDAHYPLRMPTAALARLAPPGSPEMAALVDCLVDGPPHHALANAAMVCLLGALLARLEARG